MSGTYTKDIFAKNQRTLLRYYGGRKNFYQYVEDFGWAYSQYGFSPVVGVRELIQQDPPHNSYYEKFLYLSRVIPNFNPNVYLYKDIRAGERNGIYLDDKNGRPRYLRADKVEQVYNGILVRDGVKLFEQIEKEHPEYSQYGRRRW